MEQRTWWQSPKLRRDEEERKERKATWLELFLDLVFVAVIAQLAHTLANHITLLAALQFSLLFIPVWWIWMGSTFYNDRFETDDVSHRLFTFFTIIAVAALAYNAHDALGESSVGFALAYAGARVVLIVMWCRGGWHNEEAKPLTLRYLVGFSASVVCWLTSVFVPLPARFVLWGVGLTFDLITPLTTMRIEARMPRLTHSHLPERFGLLIIIVLGESVVGVVQGMTKAHHLTARVGWLCLLALALAFSLWWIYFDHVASRRPKPGIWWTLAWAYSHLVLAIGLTAIGAGLLNVVASETSALDDPVRWLICGAVSVTLVSLGILELTLAKQQGEVSVNLQAVEAVRFTTAAIALLLGLFGGALNSFVVFGGLVVLAVGQVLHGLRPHVEKDSTPAEDESHPQQPSSPT